MKSVLLHLGHNLWCDWYPEGMQPAETVPSVGIPDGKLRCRRELFIECCDYAAEKGVDTIVVDCAEGVVYPSHPELAIEGSWQADDIRELAARMKAKGVRLIPKLNFSSTHNGWLKMYRRMLSTPKYYEVQRDLIRDVAGIFDHPEMLHIGMDEEYTARQVNSKRYEVVMIRSPKLYREDFLRTVDECEKAGMRAWSWADYVYRNPEFADWCPRSVLLSNYYYDEDGAGFDPTASKDRSLRHLTDFDLLESRGFEQAPCISNWVGSGRRKKGMTDADDAIAGTVGYCRAHIAADRLKGFCYAPWIHCTRPDRVAAIKHGIDLYAATF